MSSRGTHRLDHVNPQQLGGHIRLSVYSMLKISILLPPAMCADSAQGICEIFHLTTDRAPKLFLPVYIILDKDEVAS